MIYLLKINLVKILKSPGLWIGMIYIIFFLSIVPAAFTAAGFEGDFYQASILLKTQISAAIIITGLLIVIVNSFIESYVKIKDSIIYKNFLLSKKPKSQFYFATIFPVIFYFIMAFIISFLTLVSLDSLGAISGKNLGNEKNIIMWSDVQWGFLILSIVITIFVGISLLIFISSFVKRTEIFISISWAYLLLVFFFGGSSVPIFLIRGPDSFSAFKYISFFIPNVWTNFLFVNSFSNSTHIWYDFVIPIEFGISFLIYRGLILKKRKK